MEEYFYLLKCKATEELMFLFDNTKGVEYTLDKKDGFDVYKLTLNLIKNKTLVEIIKDINIYIPKVKEYISDYILLKKTPTKKILKYINLFTSDDLFLPYISQSRIKQATIKHHPKYAYLASNKG